MGRPCRICTHPDRKEIERSILLKTETEASIARRLGTSQPSVSRHRTGHMAQDIRHEFRRDVGPVKPVELLTELVQDVREVLQDTAGRGAVTTRLLAVKELRQLVESIGRFTGELNDRSGTQVNIIASPDWLAIRGVLLEELAAYPEARTAVAGRLLELEAPK
jgi:hypothetical protein